MYDVYVQASSRFSNDRLDVPAWIKKALLIAQRLPLKPPASRHPLLCARGIKRQVMGTGALIKLAAVSPHSCGVGKTLLYPLFSQRSPIEQVRDKHFALVDSLNGTKARVLHWIPFKDHKSLDRSSKGTHRSSSIRNRFHLIPFTAHGNFQR